MTAQTHRSLLKILTFTALKCTSMKGLGSSYFCVETDFDTRQGGGAASLLGLVQALIHLKRNSSLCRIGPRTSSADLFFTLAIC